MERNRNNIGPMDEAFEQLEGRIPTHVSIQCGVGSFAAAMQTFFVEQ